MFNSVLLSLVHVSSGENLSTTSSLTVWKEGYLLTPGFVMLETQVALSNTSRPCYITQGNIHTIHSWGILQTEKISNAGGIASRDPIWLDEGHILLCVLPER